MVNPSSYLSSRINGHWDGVRFFSFVFLEPRNQNSHSLTCCKEREKMSRWNKKMKKSKVHTIYFEASRKMGIAWKGNVVRKVLPGSQAEELGVRADMIALMLNARQIPSEGSLW